MNRKRKTQSMVQVSIVLTTIVMALFTMQTYMRRGLQARYKTAVDAVSGELSSFAGQASALLQYEPYYLDRQSHDERKYAKYETLADQETGRQVNWERYFYSESKYSYTDIENDEDDINTGGVTKGGK
ncbi:MAG: hypothetical protein ABH858_02550 [Candidatus Omnitrophota bacterium]